MILSRGNLAVAEVARVDGLAVMVLADGATVGMARRAVMAVEPVPEEVKKGVPLGAWETGEVALSVETALEVVRAMPRDKLFGGLLEHAEVHRVGEDGVEVVLTDGKRTRSVHAKAARTVGVTPAMRQALRGSRGVGVVLNRKRLLAVLEALDHACSDGSSGEGAVWLEVTEAGVLMRSVATRTGQRAVAYMVRAEGVPEMEASQWERKWKGAPRRGG